MIPLFAERSHDVLEHYEVHNVGVRGQVARRLYPHPIIVPVEGLTGVRKSNEMRRAESEIAMRDEDLPGHNTLRCISRSAQNASAS